jgi:hypothetical protein
MWWLIGLCLITGGTQCEPSGPTTPLFARKIPNCREWAEAANYYIELGEAAGLARLKRDASKHRGSPLYPNERAAHLCRILFEPKGSMPLRPPALGALALPYESMSLNNWPEFPMVAQDGVWFMLAEGYELGGHAEPLDKYTAYCQAAGRYRTAPVKVPTTADAQAAFETLLGSNRWKSVKWSHKSVGRVYTYDSNSVIRDLRRQSEF